MLDSLDTLIAFALIFLVVSLLITIVVQMISSISNLRGKNLAWGIAEAFEAIEPDLKARAKGQCKALADHLLKDPLLSDFQLGRIVGSASAVRADEMFDLLHRIASGEKKAPENKDANAKSPYDPKGDIIKLFGKLGVSEGNINDLQNKGQGTLDAINSLTDAVGALTTTRTPHLVASVIGWIHC